MRKRFLLSISLVLASTVMLGAPKTKPTDDYAPLDKVIKQVQAAIDEYQNNLGAGNKQLPPLASAEFDFKTTTGTTVSGGLSILIFKIGVSREKDTVNDVTYTYAPPEPPPSNNELQSNEPPPTLKDELAKTIQEAAKNVAASTIAAGLPFNQLTVNLQYGVKWDVNAAGSPQLSLVTINLGGDKNKNRIQSVKLTWKVKSKPSKPS
jgi:hypothetical protein